MNKYEGYRRQKKRPTAKAALGAAALTFYVIANSQAGGSKTIEPNKSMDEQVVCEPRGEQDFTFGEQGNGVNDAIHAITGTGKGPGDPCWSEGANVVREQLSKHGSHPGIPQDGMVIHLPDEFVPHTKTPEPKK
jgi:hypothetical protein